MEQPHDIKAGLADNSILHYKTLKQVKDFVKSVPEKYKKNVQKSGIFTFFPEPLKDTLTDVYISETDRKDLLVLSTTIYEVCAGKDLQPLYVKNKIIKTHDIGKNQIICGRNNQ